MPIETGTYTVVQEVRFSVPSYIVRDIIRDTKDESLPAGFSKIYAMKHLRAWFEETHGQRLGLKDAV